MTPARAAYILRMIALQDTAAGCRKLRAELSGEEWTTEVYAALLARIDALHKLEARG